MRHEGLWEYSHSPSKLASDWSDLGSLRRTTRSPLASDGAMTYADGHLLGASRDMNPSINRILRRKSLCCCDKCDIILMYLGIWQAMPPLGFWADPAPCSTWGEFLPPMVAGKPDRWNLFCNVWRHTQNCISAVRAYARGSGEEVMATTQASGRPPARLTLPQGWPSDRGQAPPTTVGTIQEQGLGSWEEDLSASRAAWRKERQSQVLQEQT